jgi:hypothetical protein
MIFWETIVDKSNRARICPRQTLRRMLTLTPTLAPISFAWKDHLFYCKGPTHSAGGYYAFQKLTHGFSENGHNFDILAFRFALFTGWIHFRETRSRVLKAKQIDGPLYTVPLTGKQSTERQHDNAVNPEGSSRLEYKAGVAMLWHSSLLPCLRKMCILQCCIFLHFVAGCPRAFKTVAIF